MRLIDADKIDFGEVYKGGSDFARDMREAAKELIDRQPVAYDVDKVVERLNKASDYYECEEQGREHVQMIDLTDAVEIVITGGDK